MFLNEKQFFLSLKVQMIIPRNLKVCKIQSTQFKQNYKTVGIKASTVHFHVYDSE